jgi:hypothetical protein
MAKEPDVVQLLSRPITLPVGILLAGIWPVTWFGLRMSGVEQDPSRDAAEQQLHDDYVRLNATIERLSDTISEVKAIEEAAHPRYGVPPAVPIIREPQP